MARRWNIILAMTDVIRFSKLEIDFFNFDNLKQSVKYLILKNDK